MKILIDNNVILDALLKRSPFNEGAEKIMIACSETHEGCISVNSLTDIFYILRKLTDVPSANAAIIKLTELFDIITVTGDDCVSALELQIDDFEDALIVICGMNAGANYIVTRDNSFLNVKSGIPVISPDSLLDIINHD